VTHPHDLLSDPGDGYHREHGGQQADPPLGG
jgi:hypothetical protein